MKKRIWVGVGVFLAFMGGVFLEKVHSVGNGCPDWTQIVTLAYDGKRDVPISVTKLKLSDLGHGYVPVVGDTELFDLDGSRQPKVRGVNYSFVNGRWVKE